MNKPLMFALTSAVVLLGAPAALPVFAQSAAPPPTADYQPLSDSQLEQLLGPIALYPDPLLAEILPAATLPTQIVLADRYVTGGGDPGLIEQQPWDASVQAVAHYPSVLQYLDDNLDWTAELGQAFLNQQQQVMDAIQRLRISARNMGNLVSTPQQQVVDDSGYIEILPVEENVVYVPVYQPDSVYDQTGFGLGFGAAFSFGPWLAGDFDWNQHHLYFWNQAHERPADWWRERPDERRARLARQSEIWQPENHRDRIGAEPGDRGWNRPETASTVRPVTVVNLPHSGATLRPAAQTRPAAEPRPAAQPRPAATRNTEIQAVNHPQPPQPGKSAFIGSESSRAAKSFSKRGQESLQSTRPAEPTHSAAPVSHAPPSGGGSAAHVGSSTQKH